MTEIKKQNRKPIWLSIFYSHLFIRIRYDIINIGGDIDEQHRQNHKICSGSV